jgi:hypothetical protein
MKIQTWPMRYILTAALAVLAVVIIVGAASLKRRESRPAKIISTSQQEAQHVEPNLPPVISSVKGLKIERAFIDEQKQINIVLLNKTGKGIQSFAVSSGNFMVITDNGLIADNPKTIIEPDTTYTIQVPVSDLEEKTPVVISAVLYDDGTEAGDNAVREKMHDARRREKERRLSQTNDNRGK